MLDTLEPLWQRFLRLRDDDYEGMVEVAAEWLEALDEDPEDPPIWLAESMMGEPLPGEGEGEGGEGRAARARASGEGEGEGDGEAQGREGFGKKIKGKVARTETKIDGEVVEARGDERPERRGAERKADAERRKAAEREHESRSASRAGCTGTPRTGSRTSRTTRQPTADERRAAKALARALEKIDYRDRAVTKVTSIVPPGRLRGRAAVQAEAYGQGAATPRSRSGRASVARKVDSHAR